MGGMSCCASLIGLLGSCGWFVVGELFFLRKNLVKVWWIEMFALLLQRTIFLGEAAKLSHPPRMRAISF